MLFNSILKNKNNIRTNKFDEEMINLCSKTFQIPNSFRYRAIKVNKDHIARPDIISYHHYGDPQYGDLLCKLNGISNPMELNEDDVLLIPDYEDLVNFMTIDDYDDLANDSKPSYSKTGVEDMPISKTKNEKRKPNESVIGDTRFKIDATNRLIIY